MSAQAGVRQGSLGHSALVTPWLSLRDNSQVTSAPVAPRVGLREIITSGLAGRRDSQLSLSPAGGLVQLQSSSSNPTRLSLVRARAHWGRLPQHTPILTLVGLRQGAGPKRSAPSPLTQPFPLTSPARSQGEIQQNNRTASVGIGKMETRPALSKCVRATIPR